jgi:Fe-S cluster assembly scaffold protein SufB
MAMNNAKNVNYWQIDHKIESIFDIKGVVVLASPVAWEKYPWFRLRCKAKPKEGYFVWVRKQIDFPLSTCIMIASPNISQELTNFLIIEKGIKAKANVVCSSQKGNLCGRHIAKGQLILKAGSSLEYNHFHQWGQKDSVNPEYEFFLGENSSLVYNYKNLLPPQELKLVAAIHCRKNASCQINSVINGINTKIKIEETIYLEEDNSRGISTLKIVGDKRSDTEVITKIVAAGSGKGHLDCQGLLIDKSSTISFTPTLISKNNKAQLTHESSIGKISDEQLSYLRSRGLSEKEASKLIISGFLDLNR